MRLARIVRLLLIVATLGVMSPPTGAAPSSGAQVTLLRTPDGGIQPQVAVDAKGVVHLIYFKGEAAAGDLFYAQREPGRDAFSAPIRVNSQPGSAVAAGTIRGGQLAIGKGGRVHVAWNGSRVAGDAPSGHSPMLYARLNDAGNAFEPQRNLMHFTRFLDGGGSIAADDKGNVYVAWHAGDGSAQGEQGRRLWIARSRDDGKAFARETAAYAEPTGACACCGTRSFVDRQGTLYVLYRAAFTSSDRDMVLLVSRDHGATFKGTRIHPWKVSACPMSSEAFVEGSGGVLGAWETGGQVYFARMDAATAGRSEPIAAPGASATRKHPALATNARGETILVWSEGTGWQKGGALAWQVFDKAGHPTAEKGKIEGGIATWSLAAVFARPDGGFTIIH